MDTVEDERATGSVDRQIAEREAIEHLRAVLDDIDAGQLACSVATRARIQGAILAMSVIDSLAPSVPTTLARGR